MAGKLSVTCGCDMEAKQYEYGGEEKIVYVCPMHPEVQGDEPGRCPKCGMDLVRKGESTGGHTGHNMPTLSHMDHDRAMANPAMAKEMEADMRRRFFISLALTVPIFLYSPAGEGLLSAPLPAPIPVAWLLFILTTPVVFWTGSIFITGTYFSLKARKLNMAVLIAFGVLATYLSSLFIMLSGGKETFFEAGAMLVTFVLFGHWLEMKSRRGTSDALHALFNLVPPQARVIRNGKELSILSAEVVVGDIVVLKPGDKVPVDGEVVSGETTIDEALITGESLPISKKAGDMVVGGSINQNGALRFRATKVGSDTVLAQIIKLVETAQNSKAPGQRIADKAASWLVAIAVGAGFITFFGWYVFAGASFLTALTFAVAAVVVACPDSLGLATPTAVAVGTGLGAKHGILFKDAMTLESASKIQAIVLDKTGTLTEGKPKVTDIVAFGGFSEEDVIRFAASVEAKSSHPIAAAIIEEAKRRGISLTEAVDQFRSLSGLGLEAVVDGKHILIGTERLFHDKDIGTESMEENIGKLLANGKTLSIVAVDNVPAGLIGIFDPVRETSKKTVAELKKMDIETVMITGDNKKIAEAVGAELGIDRVFAEVLPEDKAEYVKKLQGEGKFVAMVGDGVNDAPALAQANVGIAIGAGTDVAIETANIVLMRSNPYDIVAAIRLSKATVRKMKQNLIWAATYNTLAIPIAAGALYPAFGILIRPEWAALLMSGDSVAVAINAVLLKRVEPKLTV